MAGRIACLGALTLMMALESCAGPNYGPSVARGPSAYDIVPADESGRIEEYRIGVLDTIDVSVFQEPDLSMKALVVDSSGNIGMPLIGRVQAAGLTSPELATNLEKLLGARYYEHPQVTVSVTSSTSQRVTVEGEVSTPGVFPLKGVTTLMDAIALAGGETRTAALKEIVVLRTIDGQRQGALFDLSRIRRGEDPDPRLLGNDKIFVGYSNAKGVWRDILQAAPLFNAFRPLYL